MAVAPPEGFILYATGPLEKIFVDYKELHERMQQQVFQTYGIYLGVLSNASRYKEFWAASYNLTFSLKQGYAFHVQSLGVGPLVEILDRTTICAYMSSSGLLCAHMDVVPETVKAIHYNHVPFTSQLH